MKDPSFKDGFKIHPRFILMSDKKRSVSFIFNHLQVFLRKPTVHTLNGGGGISELSE